ncbi:TRAP transporter large permease [Roseovarius indicus]|uniref:TRAP transporter large permease protein n=1 Tax=Roseovarius indicus TaxID=540747 RepID=A0A0T5PB84_9RHOB|nr:TRAP transporter large permease subunit [Roseovarius indicus]KRS18126.1 C4-dicarboxylate ABC transporter [Roseovarius indicus]QEW27058.1 Neu5Ac permease [Roseovarius indicus]SFD54971.1 TRAP transporter, DctM subunit [Roseovarius indicus]
MTDTALPLAMAALTLAGILAGYRVAMVLAGSAALFILVSDLPTAYFNLLTSRIYANVLSNWLLVAIPMFIFMGLVLEKTGVAERSLRAAQQALGGSAAGMGISVLVIGVLLAASSGIVGASVVLLALLALPRLQETGYDKPTSAGLIAASGTLAILIPPSVMLIVLGDQLQTPVPDMFAGAIGPGLLLVAVYGILVAIRARGLPRAPRAEGRANPLRLLLDLGPLLSLIVIVLGSIIAGYATPTEASGLGAFGAILVALLYRRFDLSVIMDAARQTVTTTSMVLLVMIGATCFSAVFKAVGGDDMVETAITAFGTEPLTVLAVVMGAIFLLGFVLDWLEITLILMPIFAPIVAGLDFGNGLTGDALLVWFGILVAVNLQTSFLTPPFGFSLFYLRGAAAGQLTTTDIYKGVLPFILLQLLVLGLIIAFPVIVTGLL